MRIQVYLLSAAVALIGGAASAKQSCDGADTAAAVQGPTAAVESAGAKARTAAACGYDWSAANLMERQTLRRPSVQARFNLAATYTKTGRYEEAATLYRSVAQDGQYTYLVTDPDFANPDARSHRVNAASESWRRLTELNRIIRVRSASTASAASATGSAVDVSATVAAETPAAVVDAVQAGHISDAQALTRDAVR